MYSIDIFLAPSIIFLAYQRGEMKFFCVFALLLKYGHQGTFFCPIGVRIRELYLALLHCIFKCTEDTSKHFSTPSATSEMRKLHSSASLVSGSGLERFHCTSVCLVTW